MLTVISIFMSSRRDVPGIVHYKNKVLAEIGKKLTPVFKFAFSEHMLLVHYGNRLRTVVIYHIALNIPRRKIIGSL